MDFRPTSQPLGRPAAAGTPAPVTPEHRGNNTAGSKQRKLSATQLLSLVLLLAIALLLLFVAVAIGRGNNGNESQYVNKDQYQAVFLNNGQVYFGHIENLNSQYVRMVNIYYLTQSSDSSSSTASNNYSLVKLGCQQIHDPYDQMVINRDQVTFWENLNDSGKVVSSIKQFQKQNPNGPDCSQVSNQTQASDTTGTQGGSTPTTQGGSSTTTDNSSTNTNTSDTSNSTK